MSDERTPAEHAEVAAAAANVAAEEAQAAAEASEPLSPQEAELERTAIVEEETTKRELARLETELKIARLQTEKPPWLEEMVAGFLTGAAKLLNASTPTPSAEPPPAPTAVAIAAPTETEATAPGATVETVETSGSPPEESAEVMPVNPAEVETAPQRRTFSKGI